MVFRLVENTFASQKKGEGHGNLFKNVLLKNSFLKTHKR